MTHDQHSDFQKIPKKGILKPTQTALNIVFAKLKGYSAWPAKVLYTVKNTPLENKPIPTSSSAVEFIETGFGIGIGSGLGLDKPFDDYRASRGSRFSSDQNPGGRTGIIGRGVLGRYGPNHAADPILTRWEKHNGDFVVDKSSGKKVLEGVFIQRGDCGQWAIPGGMVDPGEHVSQTLSREFSEEALDNKGWTEAEKAKVASAVHQLFSEANETEVYKGYVDDPRNTDNAWMETVAINFHDDNGITDDIPLQAGSDAANVAWMTIDAQLKLYASHYDIIEKVAQHHNAHW